MGVVGENISDLISLVNSMNTKLDNMDPQILLQNDEIGNLTNETKN